MGKPTNRAPKTKSVLDQTGDTPLSPDEERACETLARLIAQAQARAEFAKTLRRRLPKWEVGDV